MCRPILMLLASSLAACSLAACTQTAGMPGAARGPTGRVILPEPPPNASGPGCGPQIAHFKEILAYDLSTGRVAQAVYDRASGQLAPADAACGAGRAGEAMAMLRRVKGASGYP